MKARKRHDPVAYAKRRYQDRRRAKLCVRCGSSPLQAGRCTCEPCTSKMARWRETERTRIAAGGPKKFRPWTNREVAALKEAYARGDTKEAIAAALNRSPVAIKTQAMWQGLSRPPRQRWWTPERVGTLRRLYGEGVLLAVIAKTFGVTMPAINAKVRKLGLRRGSGPNMVARAAAIGRCTCGLLLPCRNCVGIDYTARRAA